MPHDISGALKGRGPADAFMRQQFHIETSYWFRKQVAGCSIDPLKCFNTIFPSAVRAALLWVGVPEVLVETWHWFFTLQHLGRIWKLGSECIPVLPANHGCPEGDSYSVLAFLSLANVWSLSVRQRAKYFFLPAYADNWTWMADTFQEHAHL